MHGIWYVRRKPLSGINRERFRGWCPARSSKPVWGLETGSRWVRFPYAPAMTRRMNVVPASILDGKTLAGRIRQQLASEVAEFRQATGVVPGLTVVLVGSDPASQVYVRNKRNACEVAGMKGDLLRLAAETSQPELLATIDGLNADPSVHGILVQLPLPRCDR